ncbi:transposase [Yokenella regensburgei]|uniref:transposase n=1 Tax=Yokenella regensburgei TaxID=158877 RepID=UPI0035E3E94E
MIDTLLYGGCVNKKDILHRRPALKQVDPGTPILEVCRKLGISEATFYIYGLPPICKY